MTATHSAGSGLFALAVQVSAAAVAGIAGLTAAAGLLDSMPVATAAAIASAAGTVAVLRRSPAAGAAIDGAPRRFRVAFVVGAALLLGQLVPLTAFIIDPTIAAWTPKPWTPMISRHACSTAYWTACDAAARGGRLYDDSLSSLPQADPTAPRVPRLMGRLTIDPYEYPPSFLPLPALLRQLTPDFWGFRRLWFAITLVTVAVVAVALARRLDRATGAHAVWLTPYVLVPPSLIATLYMGNVQLATIAAALGAMLLFERRRHASGGLLLGFATAGKLYPGLLVVYLLLRREWRAAGWTTAWAAAFALGSLALYGPAPWVEFLHEMPGLLSGEAFSAFRNPAAIANNQSVPGIVFKLKLLGVPGMDFAAMRVVGWVFTAIILAATAWLALRARPDRREPVVWIAILTLATLRSPFLPTYGAFPTVWLVTLVAAASASRPALARAAVAVGLVAAFSWGIGYVPPLVNATWTTIQTIAALGIVTTVCRTLRQPAGATAPAPAISDAASA